MSPRCALGGRHAPGGVEPHPEGHVAGLRQTLVRIAQVTPPAQLERCPREDEELEERAARRCGGVGGAL